jgi:DNA-binding Xre family transcriptional regulator
MIQPKLTEVLAHKGLSSYWLAQATGIAYTTLSGARIEAEKRPVTKKAARRVAK